MKTNEICFPKATPRPWHVRNYPTHDDCGQHFGIYGPPHSDGEDCAPLMRTSREENAELVVKAVNEYEALNAVAEASKGVGCGCSVKERDSGHRSDCEVGPLLLALERLVTIRKEGK